MLETIGASLPLAAREWVGLTTGALWLALILAMLAGALKMAREYRRGRLRLLGIFTGRDANSADDAHQSLTKFRELHERGGLSDAEYRIIKSKLAPELASKATGPGGGAEAPIEPPNRKDSLALAESLRAAMANNQDATDSNAGAGGPSE